MNINIIAKNIELTDAIREYALKRVTSLEKLLSSIDSRGEKVAVNFEVGKSTNRHKSGEVFHVDCHIRVMGREFYSSADKEDLYAAIDEVKESLFRDINKNKDKKQTLFKRGATSVKKMLKGLSKRNPFTSKY